MVVAKSRANRSRIERKPCGCWLKVRDSKDGMTTTVLGGWACSWEHHPFNYGMTKAEFKGRDE